MLSALQVPQASAPMPFVRLWYARESVYVWAAGSQAHRITQAEGGEQGDPLMPALFALAFAPALRDLHADLRLRRRIHVGSTSPRAPAQPY